MEGAHRSGYRMVRRRQYSGPRALLKAPPDQLPLTAFSRAVWQGFWRLHTPDWLHQVALTGLLVWVEELLLFEHFKARHFIYCNQYRWVSRWRNVLTRRLGAESWWFAYSAGGGFQYWENGQLDGDSDYGGRHRYWAYQNADYFVSPCRPLIQFHQQHRQQIRQYHDIGNIWSELILEEAGRLNRDSVCAAWFGEVPRDKKVVAWFDTSIAGRNLKTDRYSPSNYAEAIKWYQDILRLTQECEALLMVIKPSKGEVYYVDEGPDQLWSIPDLGRELMQVWRQLKAHPRVRFLDDTQDPAHVVAASDLTVTFCFTSVSAEALGGRKRAIWYEPGERWRETFYGKEPLLTAHGYGELKPLVRKLLYEMPEAAYQRFLEERVRGTVDTFLDGQGLSRFRTLLASQGDQIPQRPQQEIGSPEPFLAEQTV